VNVRHLRFLNPITFITCGPNGRFAHAFGYFHRLRQFKCMNSVQRLCVTSDHLRVVGGQSSSEQGVATPLTFLSVVSFNRKSSLHKNYSCHVCCLPHFDLPWRAAFRRFCHACMNGWFVVLRCFTDTMIYRWFLYAILTGLNAFYQLVAEFFTAIAINSRDLRESIDTACPNPFTCSVFFICGTFCYFMENSKFTKLNVEKPLQLKLRLNKLFSKNLENHKKVRLLYFRFQYFHGFCDIFYYFL